MKIDWRYLIPLLGLLKAYEDEFFELLALKEFQVWHMLSSCLIVSFLIILIQAYANII